MNSDSLQHAFEPLIRLVIPNSPPAERGALRYTGTTAVVCRSDHPFDSMGVSTDVRSLSRLAAGSG